MRIAIGTDGADAEVRRARQLGKVAVRRRARRRPGLLVLAVIGLALGVGGAACRPSGSGGAPTPDDQGASAPDDRPRVTTPILPDGGVGVAYGATLEATGGAPPYFWRLLDGSSLPPGLSLDRPTGEISGTPTREGTFSFEVKVGDTAGRESVPARYQVFIAPPGPLIVTTTLRRGTVGAAYSDTLVATGGTGSGYIWEIAQGALPAGLTLGRSTGATEEIRGTPMAAGTATFTARVTNLAGLVVLTHERELTLTIDDRPTVGVTQRVSVDDAGIRAGGTAPSSSSDGRFIAFASEIALVADDLNLRSDVFVRDTVAGTTVRVSLASDGSEADGHCFGPVISAGGRFVAFQSGATTLVPGDTNGSSDIFVHDWDADGDGVFDETDPGARATVRVSVATGGAQAGGQSFQASISGTGRHVAFGSDAADLVAGDTNGFSDVFVHDRDQDGDGIFDEPGAVATVRVSVRPDGAETTSPSFSSAISADGRCVAFVTGQRLAAGDTNGLTDVYVRDRDADGDGVFDETGPGEATTV